MANNRHSRDRSKPTQYIIAGSFVFASQTTATIDFENRYQCENFVRKIGRREKVSLDVGKISTLGGVWKRDNFLLRTLFTIREPSVTHDDASSELCSIVSISSASDVSTRFLGDVSIKSICFHGVWLSTNVCLAS